MLSQTKLALATLASLAMSVSAHGFMANPKSRNLVQHGQGVAGTPHGMHSGGPAFVHGSLGANTNTHGLCGGPDTHNELINSGPIQSTYTAGSIIDVDINITAHHLGYFTVQVCPDAEITEECFSKNYLKKAHCTADNEECYKVWKLPTDGELKSSVAAFRNFPSWFATMPYETQPIFNEAVPYIIDIKYHTQWQLPEDMNCEHCVLRWHYMTTNSCTSGNLSSPQPEEFWNCADIKIQAAYGSTRSSSGRQPASFQSRDLVADPNIAQKWDLKCPTGGDATAPYFQNNHCVTVASVVSYGTFPSLTGHGPQNGKTADRYRVLGGAGKSDHGPTYNAANCGADFVPVPFNSSDDGSSGPEPTDSNPEPTDSDEKVTVTKYVSITHTSVIHAVSTVYHDENGRPTTPPPGSRSFGAQFRSSSPRSVSYNNDTAAEEPTTSKKSNTGMIIGAAAGGVVALGLASAAGYVIYTKNKVSNELNVNSSSWLNDDSAGTSSYETKL